MSLEGRTALVTGGAVRIGRAIVERLAADGADVVIHHHRSHAQAKQAAAAVQAQGRAAHLVRADLSDAREAERVVAEAAKRAGRPIDILVNSASRFDEGRLATMTLKDLEADLAINAWAPFALMRAVAAQDVEACIVNLLDTRITDTDPTHVPYILAKKTLAELTRMCARAYAPRVRVNAVAPGPILPPPGKGPEAIADLPRLLPLARIGKVEEVVDAVAYLIRATYTTGQVLYVDGGRHVR